MVRSRSKTAPRSCGPRLRVELCSAAREFSYTVLASGSCQSHWGHDYGEPLGHGLKGTAQASSSARGSCADRRVALYGYLSRVSLHDCTGQVGPGHGDHSAWANPCLAI